MPIAPQLIADHLRQYIEPHLACDLYSANAVQDLQIDGGAVSLSLQFGFPVQRAREGIVNAVREHLKKLQGVDAVAVTVSSQISTHAVQQNLTPLPNIKNIIAVASGKGGVGKSTVSVNLALALQAEGARVGILDADIYGPSQPRMLGVSGRPEVVEQKAMKPMVGHGIQVMSIGFLVDEAEAMIWRGPMVTSALHQLLNDTLWDNLDYLIIDLPPGTGDTQLSMSQKIPVSGAIVVTTPQDIALLDARRGLGMFRKVHVPVLGVVENMSLHICSNCGHAEPIFGEGGGAKLSDEADVDLLGVLPLDRSICAHADAGNPTVAAEPEGLIAALYRDIALKAAARLSLQGQGGEAAFPHIVISDD